MKLLTLQELQNLTDQNCPNCNIPLEFDEGNLHCPFCKKSWNYKNYMTCKRTFENNPQEYITNLKNKK